jgi:hypothetical protein
MRQLTSVVLTILPALLSAYLLPISQTGLRLSSSICGISPNVAAKKRLSGKRACFGLGMQLGREVSDQGLAGYSGVVCAVLCY